MSTHVRSSIYLAENYDFLLFYQFKHDFGARRNSLIEMVLLGTHDIYFG